MRRDVLTPVDYLPQPMSPHGLSTAPRPPPSRRWPALLAGLVLASAMACECARLPDGTDFLCEADGTCPAGLVCVRPEMICRETGAEDGCVPAVCQPGDCGPRPDGCGSTVQCGACALPLSCGAVDPGRCGCAVLDGGGTGAPEADCRDSVDNDCDGLTDCADDSCNGASCDDGNACTSGERCAAGGCDGGTPQVCPPPMAACRASGQCNPATGACAYPLLGDGTPCSDGSACTTGDACDGAGNCVGSALACNSPPNGQCYLTPGTCDGGGCAYTRRSPGTGCNDGNACTTNDACNASGICAGSPLTCSSPPNAQCWVTPGTCDAGTCTYLRRTAGSSCNDGDLCTANDFCGGAGTCQPGPPINCPAGGECEVTTCDPPTGTCGLAPAPMGTRCASQDRDCLGSICCTIGRCSGARVCIGEPSNEGSRCANDGTMCGGIVKRCHTCQSGSCAVNSPFYDATCLPSCNEVDILCSGTYTCSSGAVCEATYDCGLGCCKP